MNVHTTTILKRAELKSYEKKLLSWRPNYETWRANPHIHHRERVLFPSANLLATAWTIFLSLAYRPRCTTHCTLSKKKILTTSTDRSTVFKLLSDIIGNAASTQTPVDLTHHHPLQSFNAAHPTFPS
jgi:hypothetical protein